MEKREVIILVVVILVLIMCVIVSGMFYFGLLAGDFGPTGKVVFEGRSEHVITGTEEGALGGDLQGDTGGETSSLT